MQIGPAGEHRQRLVGRIAAQVRPQVHWVQGAGQEFQVSPVGIVHQQGHPIPMAHARDFPHGGQIAQVVGARQIDGEGLFFFFQNGRFHGFGGDGTAQVAVPSPEPGDGKIQQHRRVEEALVGIPPSKASPLAAGAGIGQIQHGPNGQTGALCGVDRPAAEEPGGVFFAPGKDAFRVVQVVRPPDLRDIQAFAAQYPPALVARHMEPDRGGCGIGPDEITDRCGNHAWSPSFSATCTIMAHSMRLRNSLQPYSYTPLTLPVAW